MAASNKYNSWIHAGFYSGLQKLSVPLSAVFITMILAHKVLTKEEMGVWAIFMTITAILELIRQGLVKTAMIKYINHAEEHEHAQVIGAGFYLNTIITVIVAVVMFVLTPWLANILEAPQLKNMLYLLQLGLLINIPFSHFEWLMYSKQLFKGLYWTYLVRQGLTLLLVSLLLIFSTTIPLSILVIIYNVAMLAGAMVGYKYVRVFLKNAYSLSKGWMVKLFHFGKYVFASGISTLVFRSADQMMLSPILGTTVFNASQNIAMRFINLSDLPSQTLGDILFPKSAQSQNSSNPSVIKYYYEKTVGASLCIVIPLVLMVMIFPKLIIYILAGPEYYDAIPYLRLIVVTSVTLSFLKQFGVIMDSTGKPGYNLASITFLALLHVCLLYFFIGQYGLLGAGYALLISHAAGFIVTQFLLHHFFKVNFLNAFKYAFNFYPEFYNIISHKLPWKKAK